MVKIIKPATEVKEVNFNLLLAGPVLWEFAGWEGPVLIKNIFGSASILFVTSLAHDLRVFLLALLPALTMLLFTVPAAPLNQHPQGVLPH